jgi:hypothetical protein
MTPYQIVQQALQTAITNGYKGMKLHEVNRAAEDILGHNARWTFKGLFHDEAFSKALWGINWEKRLEAIKEHDYAMVYIEEHLHGRRT